MEQTLKAKDKDYNKSGSFMSKYLQIYEVALLQILFEAAQEKGVIRKEHHNMCLCHDGAMIPKSAFTEENTTG
jgi:hypothetical protein